MTRRQSLLVKLLYHASSAVFLVNYFYLLFSIFLTACLLFLSYSPAEPLVAVVHPTRRLSDEVTISQFHIEELQKQSGTLGRVSEVSGIAEVMATSKQDVNSDEKKKSMANAKKDEWQEDHLYSIIILGASGDLAKKKIYPTLWYCISCSTLIARIQSWFFFRSLYRDDLLPKNTLFVGYARSKLSMEDLQKSFEGNCKVGGTGHSIRKLTISEWLLVSEVVALFTGVCIRLTASRRTCT